VSGRSLTPSSLPGAARVHALDRFFPTSISRFGVALMFAPVVWLALSSFKTPAGLQEFPPTLLPLGQIEREVEGYDDPLLHVRRDDGRRHGSRTGADPPHRHHRTDGRSRKSRRNDQGADRQPRTDPRVPRRLGELHQAARTLQLPDLSQQFGHRHGCGDAGHAADQLHGGLRPRDLRVPGPQRRHAVRDRHADDPDHHHPRAGLSGRHPARHGQFAVGGDPARRGDAHRRLPPAPVHADHPARPDRGGAHGQGVRMVDLLAHRPAAVAARPSPCWRSSRSCGAGTTSSGR
jgi:hypothetical protein